MIVQNIELKKQQRTKESFSTKPEAIKDKLKKEMETDEVKANA